MEQVEEHAENMKQIQEALATPVGAAADFDEVNYLSNSSWHLSFPLPLFWERDGEPSPAKYHFIDIW